VKPEILVVNEVSLGRLLHVKVRFEDFVVNSVNIYAPCVGAARVWFFDHMRRFMLTLPDEECVILGGDFNCTLNPSLGLVNSRTVLLLRRRRLGPYSVQSIDWYCLSSLLGYWAQNLLLRYYNKWQHC